MPIQKGPLPITAIAAFQKIAESFRTDKQIMHPSIERMGENLHPDLKGVIFCYWTPLHEDLCLFSIKDMRTNEQKYNSQWLESIGAEVFKNTSDAESWVEKEIKKYSGIVPKKYQGNQSRK